MEIDSVNAVISTGERFKAAAEGFETVKSENFDSEGEIMVTGDYFRVSLRSGEWEERIDVAEDQEGK